MTLDTPIDTLIELLKTHLREAWSAASTLKDEYSRSLNQECLDKLPSILDAVNDAAETVQALENGVAHQRSVKDKAIRENIGILVNRQKTEDLDEYQERSIKDQIEEYRKMLTKE